MSAEAAAWSSFWAAHRPGSPAACLPGAPPIIDAAQRRVWEQTARRLPKGAKVLDLATGDGSVLARLRAVRPDLKLVGIDSSPELPPAPKGIRLRPGVFMEALPFPDAGFDQVTSQFGLEYGDTERTAREIARVVRKGGAIACIVHYAGGPIVAHNLARREGLEWAVAGSGLLPRARALAAVRRSADLPTPASFRSAVEDARARFPAQTVAAEFATAILHTLEWGRSAPPPHVIETLQILEDRARSELTRIAALAKAACDEQGMARIAAHLRDAGFAVDDPGGLCANGPETVFAWLLRGTRV